MHACAAQLRSLFEQKLKQTAAAVVRVVECGRKLEKSVCLQVHDARDECACAHRTICTSSDLCWREIQMRLRVDEETK